MFNGVIECSTHSKAKVQQALEHFVGIRPVRSEIESIIWVPN